jgi:uncharacterized protein YoxC
MSKAKEFLDLQNKINNDIDTKGSTTAELADELDKLTKSLTDEEIDEVLGMVAKDLYLC